ncbi:MAG TPA: ABC transporter permease [Dongiaceae bacterium]|nr:ABC transporter permease [Dongiaceae bacterium]
MSAPAGPLPRWIEIGVMPVVNLLLALIVTGLIVLAIGENPFAAIGAMASGAFGDLYGIGYTFYYATDFIFTGLAVIVAFHAGLFNIGGEGQAYIGGLGVGIVALTFDHSMATWPIIGLAILAAAAFGAGWAFIPAYLQAKRGSHIVITTIMFNLLAATLMNYLLVHVFRVMGSMENTSRDFADTAGIPLVNDLLGKIGIDMPQTPLNLSFAWALICCVGVWAYLWRSRGGYELRATGLAPRAAQYAGIRPDRIVIEAMLISGALAGFVGLNEILGYHRQLLLDFVAGAGFTGIAVALMGRNHPVGVVLASILFGALYQGGGELAFEMPRVTRDMIVVMQGLVILFSGALAYMNRPLIERLWHLHQGSRTRAGAFAAPVAPVAAPAPPLLPTQEVPSPVTTIPSIEPLAEVPPPEPEPAPAPIVRSPEPPAAAAQPSPPSPAASSPRPLPEPIELVEAELVEPLEPIPDGVNPQKAAKPPRKARGRRKSPKEGA